MFYIKISYIIVLLTNFDSVISWYFLSKYFEAFKELHQYWFPISINRNISSLTISVIKRRINRKAEKYQGSSNHDELYIMNQTQTDGLQVTYDNTLLYSVSLSNFPSPGCGMLWILIIDIISKSAVVLFTLLSASKYHLKNTLL